MEESRFPKRVLYMNLETTRPRGRPRSRWLDEVREDGRWRGVAGKSVWQGGMEEAPENGKESPHSAHANGLDWTGWVHFNFLTQKLFVLRTVCYYILWWHKKESNHILDHLVFPLASFIAAQLNKKLSALYKPKGPLLFTNAYQWIHILSHLNQIHTPHFYKLAQTGYAQFCHFSTHMFSAHPPTLH